MGTIEPQFAKVKSAHHASCIRKYPDSANGPFVVMMRQLDTPINLITVADSVNRYYPSVTQISKKNQYTVKINLKERDEANHLTQNPTFTSKYRVYVPCRNVEIDGIINEHGLNPNDILKYGEGKFKNPHMKSVPILRCNQLAKFSLERNEYLPANGMRLTFAGTILPDFVEYNRVHFQVRLFIPKIMYCPRCNQYGHTAKFCRSPEQPPGNVCTRCKAVHVRIQECPNFKEMSLKLKRQYKLSYKEHHISASSGKQDSSIPLQPSESTGSTRTQPCNQKQPEQKPSSKVNPTIALPQLVSLICDVAGVEDKWRGMINTAMPFWKHLWRFIVLKIPELDNFVTY